MAPYNPEVKQVQEPGPVRFAPIDPPQNIQPRGVETNRIMPEGVKQGDLSAEYEGKSKAYSYQAEAAKDTGFGKLFENITAVADFAGKAGVAVVKKDIEDRVYSVANRERLAYTEALEKIKSGVGVKNILDANASMDEESTPEEIAQLPATLDGLTAARDSGKISGTYYTSRLLAEAKDLRARYPGFREEIDNAFAKVTGMNPANAYIRALVTDINRASSAGKTQRNQTLTWLRNNYMGTDIGRKAYQELEAGVIDDNEVYRRLAPYEEYKFKLNQRNLQFSDDKLTREEKAVKAKSNIDYSIGVSVATATDALLARIGINGPDDVTRIDGLTKAGVLTAPQWNEWGQQIERTVAELRIRLSQDADKYGHTEYAGGKEIVNKQIEEGLKPLLALREMVYARDTGGVFNASRENKAIGDQDTNDLLKDSIMGPFHRQVQVMKNIGGEQYMKELNLESIKKGISGKYQSYYTRWSMGLATQQSMKPGGAFVTFENFVDEVQRKGIADPKLNAAVIDEVKKIGRPDVPDQIKINYARAAFSPGNYGLIAKLTDPKGNPSISSQTSVFQKFTSPDITKEMKRLGEHDPQLWENYVNWTKHQLTNYLIKRDMDSLAEVRNPAIRVSWDGDNKRFEARYDTQYVLNKRAEGVDVRTTPDAGGQDMEFRFVQQAVNRLNGSLSNFKNVAVAGEENIDRFVLSTIAEKNPEALKNVESIPYQILRDIGIANLKNQKKGIGSK